MAKPATLKDVLYALEFTGARLCRWPSHKTGAKAAWSLEPGGTKVPGHIADQARASGPVASLENRPDGYEAFVWRRAA